MSPGESMDRMLDKLLTVSGYFRTLLPLISIKNWSNVPMRMGTQSRQLSIASGQHPVLFRLLTGTWQWVLRFEEPFSDAR